MKYTHTRLAGLAAAALLLPGLAATADATAAASAPAAPAARAATLAAAANPCGTVRSPGRYTHVIWVWMENHSYGTIIGSKKARYINQLAADCGLATN